MKVYFSASVSARAYNDENDRKIVECLKDLVGKDIYSEHIFNNVINSKYEKRGLSPDQILEKSYVEIMHHIKNCDLMVAEISYPSVAVGHEISYALNLSKQIILLHIPGKSSRLMEGIRSPNLYIVEYTSEKLREVLEKVIEKIKKNMDVRFNFFLPKELLAQLDWVALNQRINKSEYVRQLIEKDMKKNKRYVG
jgi:hypothetical protein